MGEAGSRLGGTPSWGCRMPSVLSGAGSGSPSPSPASPLVSVMLSPAAFPGRSLFAVVCVLQACEKNSPVFFEVSGGCHPGKLSVCAVGVCACRKSRGQRECANGCTQIDVYVSQCRQPPHTRVQAWGIQPRGCRRCTSLERKVHEPLEAAMRSRVNLRICKRKHRVKRAPPAPLRLSQGQPRSQARACASPEELKSSEKAQSRCPKSPP